MGKDVPKIDLEDSVIKELFTILKVIVRWDKLYKASFGKIKLIVRNSKLAFNIELVVEHKI